MRGSHILRHSQDNCHALFFLLLAAGANRSEIKTQHSWEKANAFPMWKQTLKFSWQWVICFYSTFIRGLWDIAFCNFLLWTLGFNFLPRTEKSRHMSLVERHGTQIGWWPSHSPGETLPSAVAAVVLVTSQGCTTHLLFLQNRAGIEVTFACEALVSASPARVEDIFVIFEK